MQTRTVLLLPFVVALAVACGDASLPPPEPEQPRASRLRADARTERLRLAGQFMAPAPATSSTLNATAAALAAAMDAPAGTTATLTAPADDSALVLPTFGVIKPRMGNTLAVLSTGTINQHATRATEPGTDFTPTGIEGDAVTLRLTFNVRAGISRMSFDYRFLSAESPDYVGSEFNDVFTVRVTDATNTRIIEQTSVNSAEFFDASATRAGGSGFDLLADDPDGIDYFPITYPSTIPTFPDMGITNYKIINIPIRGGGPVTLEFSIQDLGDGILDSAVVLDNITFGTFQVVDPNPELIDRSSRTVSQDLEALANEENGASIRAVVADGETKLVVRAKVSGAGNMVFSVPAATGNPNGVLSAIGSSTVSNTVSVPAVQLSTGFYALALYTSPEDFNNGTSAGVNKRTTTLSAAFTPTGGTAVTETLPLNIIRPPLVVVHDIWSSCLFWTGSARISGNPLFDVTCADYALYNSAGIESPQNVDVVSKAVDEALTEHRHDNVAVTQVDVIGHGMGGLMARKFVDRTDYHDDSNLGKGYFNRLITVNTPHLGTRIADEVVRMRTSLNASEMTAVRNMLRNFGVKIDGAEGGAIDDLVTQSPTINSIQTTVVPSHVLVGTGGNTIEHGTAFEMLLPSTRTLYINMQNRHPYTKGAESSVKDRLILTKLDTVTGNKSRIFCDDPYDLFLAEADQRGGLANNSTSTPLTTFPVVSGDNDSEHFQVMSNDAQDNRIVELLNSPVKGPLFATSMPAPGLLTRENSCPPTLAPLEDSPPPPEPLPLLAGAMQIVSPAAGTPVTPGSLITVSLQGTGGFLPVSALVGGVGHGAFMKTAPFTTQLRIPRDAIGTVTLTAYGFDATGTSAESPPLVLPVTTTAKLTSMSVINGDSTLRGVGSTRHLVVVGHYDDGVKRDISSPALGTVYSASNADVATVTLGGTVTSQGVGLATIVIRNGGLHTSITVKVSEGSTRQCLDVHLGDYNLFVQEDYREGIDVGGQVAAGGNISLKDFQVGWKLPATETTNVLVAGGNLILNNGTVWGNARYGGQLLPQGSVVVNRGTAARGNPIDFAARFTALRALSTRLSNLPSAGTVIIESWGGVLLRGVNPEVNVFNVEASVFTNATLLSLEAPANSLAVINVRGTTARFANFGHVFTGGIDEHGVLFNFPEATAITAFDYGFYGTVLAPNAHFSFANGSWVGGIYARSLIGNAVGHISRLRDTTICQ
ncbi:choice-of-anchor A family protein [Myxococcus sp. CA056]|uniref:choice-of-anchor A family protein n=1 Tax=Myxococcus sp. CA056 TaxID=2741740 RepID=UPI00157A22B6|nr:choice-of-anchor A family protein [Myxococcus sp. CA056]NTX12761.1 choice-of-anchor A family protein [Myxococcus sp. CA056]